jgi:hypothetical protein
MDVVHSRTKTCAVACADAAQVALEMGLTQLAEYALNCAYEGADAILCQQEIERVMKRITPSSGHMFGDGTQVFSFKRQDTRN